MLLYHHRSYALRSSPQLFNINWRYAPRSSLQFSNILPSWFPRCDHSGLFFTILDHSCIGPYQSPCQAVHQPGWCEPAQKITGGSSASAMSKSFPKDKKLQILRTVTVHFLVSECSMPFVGFRALKENIEDHFVGTRSCKGRSPSWQTLQQNATNSH